MVLVGALAETAVGSFFPQLETAHTADIARDMIASTIVRFSLRRDDIVNMETSFETLNG
jgi:hypothetical protein